MSRWSNEFENHQIHETLRQAAEWLDLEVVDTDAEFEDERRRLKKVLVLIQEVVGGLDREFFPKIWLDQINQHLRHPQFFQQLQHYSSSPSLDYLRAANNHVTQYAPQIFHLAAMTRPVESQEIIKQAERRICVFQ